MIRNIKLIIIVLFLSQYLYCSYIKRPVKVAVWPVKTVCLPVKKAWHFFTYYDTTRTPMSENKAAMAAYNKGMELMEDEEIDSAITEFKQAVKLDKKFVEAHHQMGLAYLEKNTIRHRRKAVKSMREALFWDRDNFNIHLDLGKAYLMQRYRFNAKWKFNWLKKTDPNNIELLLSLGKLYKEDVEYYQNMVDVFTDASGVLSFVDEDLLSAIFAYDGTGPVKEFLSARDEFDAKFQDFSSYLKKDFANAAVAFSQVLSIEPNNREALYELSLLAFTAGMYTEFVKYQEKLLELYPNDKDIHLFLGLGYHRIKKYEMAYKEFGIARSLMEADEREVFDSLDYIVPYGDRKRYQKMNSDEKEKYSEQFWRGRDPLFLTQYNERILEHYCRVAYANLKFTPRKMKEPVPGWKTDRGMVYIRYGQPFRIARLRPSQSSPGSPNYELTEIWYYDNFTFAFSDEYMTGNFKLGSRNRLRNVNFDEIVDLQYQENSELYQHKYKGSFFQVPNYTADFRGSEKNTQTEIYYALPKNSLTCSAEDTSDVAEVVKGFFIFDENWNELKRSVTKEKFYFKPNLEPLSNFHIISQDQIEILPGEYNFAFELLDEKSGNTHAERAPLKVESYKIGSLCASDVVLASLIDSTFEKSPFGTHNLPYDMHIVPNPARMYKKTQPVYLYFEVYNLSVIPPGETSFDVTYHIKSVEKKKSAVSGIWDRIEKTFGKDAEKMEISSSYTYQGSTPVEKVYLSIDMSSLANDIYDLAVRIKDLNTGNTVIKETQFTVQNQTIYYLY